jgi:hypothetical protein
MAGSIQPMAFTKPFWRERLVPVGRPDATVGWPIRSSFIAVMATGKWSGSIAQAPERRRSRRAGCGVAAVGDAPYRDTIKLANEIYVPPGRRNERE